MARSRSSSSRQRRGVTNTASVPTLPFGSPPSRAVYRHQMELFPVQDNRVFHPDGPLRSQLTTTGQKHSLVAKNHSTSRPDPFAPMRIAFQRPKRLLVCIRRHMRKEVMFAKNKAGRSGQKRPTRNFYSSISCKG